MIRKFEYDADRYACTMGNYGEYLNPALINLFKTDKGPMTQDWLYSMFTNNHPTLEERIIENNKTLAI